MIEISFFFYEREKKINEKAYIIDDAKKYSKNVQIYLMIFNELEING